MMRECRLQRVVMGIGVGREVLEVRRSDSLKGCARTDIVAGRIHNLARVANRARSGTTVTGDRAGSSDRNNDGILHGREPGLIRIVRGAKARPFRSHIAEFGEPLMSQGTLDGQIPLLSRPYDPV